MSNLRQAAQQALEALEGSRRSHYYCEDTWYSCPQHEGGCANEAEGDECNCGADKANEKIDQAITAIEQALAEPEQKPVAWYCNQGLKRGVSLKQESPEWMPLYTAPTPRKPLTNEEISAILDDTLEGGSFFDVALAVARAIERAHGIGEQHGS